MRIIKHLGLSIAAALLALCAVEVTGNLPIPGAGQLASTAQARVGRPLTPTYRSPLCGRRLLLLRLHNRPTERAKKNGSRLRAASLLTGPCPEVRPLESRARRGPAPEGLLRFRRWCRAPAARSSRALVLPCPMTPAGASPARTAVRAEPGGTAQRYER
jgi:hypothetical protein